MSPACPTSTWMVPPSQDSPFPNQEGETRTCGISLTVQWLWLWVPNAGGGYGFHLWLGKMYGAAKKESMWAWLSSFFSSFISSRAWRVGLTSLREKHSLSAGVAPTALLSPPRDPKSCHSVLPWGTGAVFFVLWSEYYAFALTGLVFYIGATDLFGTRTY